MIVPPFFYKRLFSKPPITDNGQNNSKNIYLTFDDGPVPEVTEFVIEELNKYKAKATFFCVGNNIVKHQKIFEILKQNTNHSIGNHSFNHLNGWKTKNKIYFEDIKLFEEQYKTSIFRPPYGKLKFSQLIHLKKYYKIYLWSLISYDFDSTVSPEKCLKNVINNSKPGSIIVFHDSTKAEKNLFYALPRTLEQLSGKGYDFKKLR
jgi:peptidoglycan-N-acetylglucosamine deacetylase